MSSIVEMIGSCDGNPIIFKKINESEWEVIVPPDLTDGTYVVEIIAKTHGGTEFYKTAILYMCDSTCTNLEILNDDKNIIIDDDILIVDVSVENSIELFDARRIK